MRILVGRASARYSGRIDAELSPGDVVMLFRDPADGGDGSALLFDRRVGVQPRNWMPAGSEVVAESWREKDGIREGSIVISHAPRGETLEVFFHELEQEQSVPGRLSGQLSKLGAESEFADLLFEKLELLVPGLEPVSREYRTAVGPIDLLAIEKQSGRPVVIEVKRRQVTVSTAYQAMRYVRALQSGRTYRKKADALLVAPSIARGAKEWIAGEKGISFLRTSYEQLRDL